MAFPILESCLVQQTKLKHWHIGNVQFKRKSVVLKNQSANYKNVLLAKSTQFNTFEMRLQLDDDMHRNN